jgi:hypothetical protein
VVAVTVASPFAISNLILFRVIGEEASLGRLAWVDGLAKRFFRNWSFVKTDAN